jgi:hypothetical protein
MEHEERKDYSADLGNDFFFSFSLSLSNPTPQKKNPDKYSYLKCRVKLCMVL